MVNKNQNHIELLKDLISIPSFSGKEDKSADRIENWFIENGIKCSRHKNNIYAFNKYYKKEKKTLLLNSHHDTVKPNEGYSKDPYNPEMSNGKIYGLGSNDAGGALVTLLNTFKDFYDNKNLKVNSDSMLLLLNNHIYYEFIKTKDLLIGKKNYICLSDVKVGENYALVISTSSGLWRYNIGDTIQFTELEPYRIVVTGRIKHFISAFGEHVIAKEVETTIREVSSKLKLRIREFTVAPQVTPESGLPFHEWFIEFDEINDNLEEIEALMDKIMQRQNIYYKDLVQGKILSPLRIMKIKKGGFNNYMKSIGKLGGQNKVPHLSNDRKIVNQLKKYIIRQ